MKTIDQMIDESVEACLNSRKNGFRVVEVEVPLQYASKVFALLNDEISLGGKMTGWEFGVFRQGEFEGKMAQVFTKDGAEHKRYFLKYTL